MQSMKLRPGHSPRQSQRQGAAIVEMAVCLPLFLLLLLEIIESGRALMVSQLLTSAARQGCREAIMDGATSYAVTTDISDRLINTIGCSTADIQINITVTSLSTGTELSDLSQADQRDLIEIDVAVPFSAVSYTPGKFLSNSTLRGQCSMRKQ